MYFYHRDGDEHIFFCACILIFIVLNPELMLIYMIFLMIKKVSKSMEWFVLHVTCLLGLILGRMVKMSWIDWIKCTNLMLPWNVLNYIIYLFPLCNHNFRAFTYLWKSISIPENIRTVRNMSLETEVVPSL